MKGKKRWISLWAVGLLLALLAAPAYGAEPDLPGFRTEFFCGTSAETQEELQAALIQKKGNELREEAGIAPYLGIQLPHLMPSTGRVRLLVLPIMFADSKPLTGSWEGELEYYQQLFNGEDDGGDLRDQSVHSYFLRQSYGRLNVTADVLPIYFADAPKEAYTSEKDNVLYYPKYEKLQREAFRTYKIDYSQYDADGDDSIDCICIIEGSGYINGYYGAFNNAIGGHATYAYKTYKDKFTDSMEVSTLAYIQQEQGDRLSYVAVHELCHAMGLGDNYISSILGDGANKCVLPSIHNDLMASRGRYINIFYKYMLGWLDPVILTEESPIQTLELYAGEHQKRFEKEAKAVLYIPDKSGLPFTEFFIAEYRNNADIPEGGGNGQKPGVTLWHCIADLDDKFQEEWKNKLKYLQSVRPTGGASNWDFTAADFFVPQGPPWNAYSTSSVISPDTTPTNSDFENGVPTQFYMEVLDQDEDRAVLRVGSLSAYAPAQETLRILPAELTYGDPDVQLAAEGGSGTGDVTWELLSGDAITLTADGRAAVRHVGKCRVKATKAGDAACPAPVSASLTVTVKPKNIASDVSVACSPLEYYTGKPIEPVLQVTDPNAVITAEDYDVSYRDNIELGKGTILLTGKGNYEGTKAVTFRIVRKETITTPEQLRQLAAGVNSGDDSYCQGYFELAADIDLGGEACPWTPIGSVEKRFSGVFDGKGHSVTGIYVNEGQGQGQGLFGYVERSGEIKNLCVGGILSGRAYVGGVVGRNAGRIVNCYNTCTISGVLYAGGIAATNSGTIENCYSVGKVSGRDRVGGIAGQNLGGGVVKKCYNYALVEGESSLVGSLVGNVSGKVEGCYYLSGTADKGLGSGDDSDMAEEKSAEGFWEESGFPGWDFADVWVMSDTLERPVLRSVPELPDHIHSYSADWTADRTGHWYECKYCGKRIEESVHDPVEDKEEEPTCTLPGKTAGSHCSVCGYVIKVQEGLPPAGHRYAAAWSKDASGHWRECTVCGNISDAASHAEDTGRVTKEPTLEEEGRKTFFCWLCGYELRTEILPKLEPAHEHTFSAAWKRDEVGHWHECDCGERGEEAAHDPVEDMGEEPTCTLPGRTAGSHCSVCNYVMEPQRELPAAGHRYATVWSGDPSGHWHECTACGDKKDKDSHTEDGGRVTKEPTLEEEGLRTFACSVCGYELWTEILPRLEPAHEHTFSAAWERDEVGHWHECDCGERAEEAAHDPVEDKGEEPTCTLPGRTAGSHCSVCDYVMEPQRELPATGHRYATVWSGDPSGHWYECTVCGDKKDKASHTEDAGRVTKEPTLEEEGLRTFACSVCGYALRTEILPRLEPAHEHTFSADWERDETEHWHECLTCQEKRDTAPHAWDDGRVTTAATTTEMGSRTYTCTVCAQTRAERIPASGGGTASGGGSTGKSYPVTVEKGLTGGVITVAPQRAEQGERVSVTVRVAKGYELTSVTAVDGRGKTLALMEQETGYAFVMPGSEVTVTAEFIPSPTEEKLPEQKPIQSPIGPLPFADVKTEAWYYETVAEIFEKGLMTGITDDRFMPDAFTSRGMVVQTLYRMEGEPTAENDSFSDVADGKYYAKAAAWAAEKEIVKGYGDGTFRPDSFITREELAAMLYRYAAYKGYDTTSPDTLSRYQDAGQISAYAREAMRWANGTGLLVGRKVGELAPSGMLSRSEMAAVFLRFSNGKK